MKSKALHFTLRVLIGLVGAGIGAALTAGIDFIYRIVTPDAQSSFATLLVAYIGMCLTFFAVFFLLSNGILTHLFAWTAAVIRKIEAMPVGQMISAVGGLLVGLVIAALVSNILQFLGGSIFTISISAILFIILGLMGYTIGYRKADELILVFRKGFGSRNHRFRHTGRHKRAAVLEKKERIQLLDASAIIDGRVLSIRETGFLEGKLYIPRDVLEELKEYAADSDESRRVRGVRGLEIANRMLDEHIAERTDLKTATAIPGENHLTALAKQLDASIVTADAAKQKTFRAAGITVLNVNELSEALRPMILPKEILEVKVTKAGREATQGVGYLDDGTMIVIEGAHDCVGETVSAVVTTALQTSAGRMIFARINQ